MKKSVFFRKQKNDFQENKEIIAESLTAFIILLELYPKYFIENINMRNFDSEWLFSRVKNDLNILIMLKEARSVGTYWFEKINLKNLLNQQNPNDWSCFMNNLLIFYLIEEINKVIEEKYDSEIIFANRIISICEKGRKFSKELMNKYEDRISYFDKKIKKLEATIKSP